MVMQVRQVTLVGGPWDGRKKHIDCGCEYLATNDKNGNHTGRYVPSPDKLKWVFIDDVAAKPEPAPDDPPPVVEPPVEKKKRKR